MTNETFEENEKALFKRVVKDENKSGELKTQFTILLTTYDTSKMANYEEGQKVYKGFTCKIATLKPSRTHPRARVDIDPSNKYIRDAIFEMYQEYDKLNAHRK